MTKPLFLLGCGLFEFIREIKILLKSNATVPFWTKFGRIPSEITTFVFFKVPSKRFPDMGIKKSVSCEIVGFNVL